jgi:hypothetical protein
MSFGMTNYLRNKLVDWFHRGVAFTPPATVWIRLVTTTPTAATAGTAVSFTGYAPQPIASSTTAWAATNADGSSTNPSSGTNGTTSNNAVVNYGTAGSAGSAAVTHWEAWDASSGGNRLYWGEIVDGTGAPAPRTIAAGDPVSFPISYLRVTWG